MGELAPRSMCSASNALLAGGRRSLVGRGMVGTPETRTAAFVRADPAETTRAMVEVLRRRVHRGGLLRESAATAPDHSRRTGHDGRAGAVRRPRLCPELGEPGGAKVYGRSSRAPGCSSWPSDGAGDADDMPGCPMRRSPPRRRPAYWRPSGQVLRYAASDLRGRVLSPRERAPEFACELPAGPGARAPGRRARSTGWETDL